MIIGSDAGQEMAGGDEYMGHNAGTGKEWEVREFNLRSTIKSLESLLNMAERELRHAEKLSGIAYIAGFISAAIILYFVMR